MGSFFGRYLRVEFPEIGRTFLSNFDKNENGETAPRIIVDANLKKGAFTQGKVSIYNLNDNTRKLMQERDFTVNIWAGWSSDGNGQIISASKKFFEVVRVGTDLITNIYFLSFGITKKQGISVVKSNIQELIKSECSKFGFKTTFEKNILADRTIQNITLIGDLNDRLDKLKSLFEFDYYEQAGQIIITSSKTNQSNEIVDVDISEGLLSIPAFSNIGRSVNLKAMFNQKLRIGKNFRITSKYNRININDDTKSFAGELVGNSLSNVKDIKYRLLDIRYRLDNKGDDFFMEVEGIQ